MSTLINNVTRILNSSVLRCLLLLSNHVTFNQSLLTTNYCILKYGTTQMEVDVDGSFSYPEPQMNVKDNGKILCFLLAFMFDSLFDLHSIWYYLVRIFLLCDSQVVLCQQKSIVQNPSILKKNNLCEYFMKINFEKYAAHFTSLIKYRFVVFM